MKRLLLVTIWLAATVTFVVCSVYLWTTETTYVDISNGEMKYEYGVFGITYRIKKTETNYSKLVKKCNCEEIPEWVIVGNEEYGLRRFFYPNSIGYHRGSEAASIIYDVGELSAWCDLPKPKDMIIEIRSMLRCGKVEKMRMFVRELVDRCRTAKE
ncbi:MAG: hypothetical protein V1809_08595 [Planctomycetota bacterium]